MHMGRNLSLNTIEIWRSEISQVEIVKLTRDGIKNGKSLKAIKKKLPIEQGFYEPDSIEYANTLVANIGKTLRATLEEPLCVVFVDLKRWQLD